MNHQLPHREVKLYAGYQQRVLFLDPSELYQRIQVRPYVRHQRPEHIGMKVMFPKRGDSICSCGCGRALGPRRSRWASDECAAFAADIYAIIYGQRDTVKFYLKHYYGYRCQCGRVRKMKVDHIVPVKHGGGGCWLSNYQFLCHACHVAKTNADFGWKPDKANTTKSKIIRKTKQPMVIPAPVAVPAGPDA